MKRITYNAPVILTFALLSLAALGLGYLTKDASTRLLFSVYGNSWTDPLGYLRLFGHSLGHANWAHLSSNFILILLIGPMIEERYGSKQLLLMMLATSLVTGIVSVLAQPHAALLGASGIAFMLILLSSFASSESGTVPVTFIFAVIIYIGGEALTGAQEIIGVSSNNVSQLTHIVGGICGVLFGIFGKRNK
ncbi:MAG: rhomboid family intramembrane serine protease [Oscillospiraceae bacterium]|nr:rhomboid family intramembrane serine protease [Oscillospiraceae bacterium]